MPASRVRTSAPALAVRALTTVAAVMAAACSSPSGDPTPSAAPAAAAPSSSATTTLAGSLHPLARPELDVGRMDPAAPIDGASLVFRRSAAQAADAAALTAALEDPSSPTYRHWLTPEQYAARFGASDEDVASTTAWLASHGLVVHGPSRTRTALRFSGTVGQIEQAFATELHRYAVGGEVHFAMSRAPSVPSSIAPRVGGLRGLHDFRVRPSSAKAGNRRARASYAFPYYGYSLLTMAPADFATVYGVAPLYARGITGQGQSIAIAGQTFYNHDDIAAFRRAFGLSATLPVDVPVPYTGDPTAVSAPDFGEATLDLEWSGAIAKDATIQYVYTGNAQNTSVWDAMYYAIDQHIAPIVSVSYTGCEAYLSKTDAYFFDVLGQAASMQGITVLASSGDSGPANCDAQFSTMAARNGMYVGFPASIGSVIAVGGTELSWGQPVPQPLGMTPSSTYWSSSSSALGYVPEAGWNDTAFYAQYGYGIAASTGGVSRIFSKPYWQAPFTANDRYRNVPDVAFSASAAQVGFLYSYSWTAADGNAYAPQAETMDVVGGTSASAPSFAGMLAIVEQAIGAPAAGLGNLNPILYALSTTPGAAGVFHDVTSGNNIVPCQSGSPDCPASAPYQYGYTAGPGYDRVTGLGSLDASRLANALATLVPTTSGVSAHAPSASDGAPLTMTVTVGGSDTSSTPSGTVTFYAAMVDTNGVRSEWSSLGTAPVTPGPEGSGRATAHLQANAPSGFFAATAAGTAQIVTFYGGDARFIASWSPATNVVIEAPVDGGAASDASASTSDAGAIVIALDDAGVSLDASAPPPAPSPADDAGSADDGGAVSAPSDAGTTTADGGASDAAAADDGAAGFAPPSDGADAGDAATTTAQDDAGATTSTDDGGAPATAAASADASAQDTPGELVVADASGCGCTTAGADGTHANAGALAGMLVGLGSIARRRRRRR